MKLVESSLWLGGTLLIAGYVFASNWSDAARVEDIDAFVAHKRSIAASAQTTQLMSTALTTSSGVPALLPGDAGARSFAASDPAPSVAATGNAIALLRIPRIALEVPVGTGTAEEVLFRGAGLVTGSALPGSDGNVAIAAHRDSFFRGLKDVAVGDLIELESLDRTTLYRVSSLKIVEPGDVQVLAPTDEAALTLITCYPFYFVGHAPQRYIVRAVAAEFAPQLPRRKT